MGETCFFPLSQIVSLNLQYLFLAQNRSWWMIAFDPKEVFNFLHVQANKKLVIPVQILRTKTINGIMKTAKFYSPFVKLVVLTICNVPAILVVLVTYSSWSTINMVDLVYWKTFFSISLICSVVVYIQLSRSDAKNIRIIGSSIFLFGLSAFSLLMVY